MDVNDSNIVMAALASFLDGDSRFYTELRTVNTKDEYLLYGLSKIHQEDVDVIYILHLNKDHFLSAPIAKIFLVNSYIVIYETWSNTAVRVSLMDTRFLETILKVVVDTVGFYDEHVIHLDLGL